MITLEDYELSYNEYLANKEYQLRSSHLEIDSLHESQVYIEEGFKENLKKYTDKVIAGIQKAWNKFKDNVNKNKLKWKDEEIQKAIDSDNINVNIKNYVEYDPNVIVNTKVQTLDYNTMKDSLKDEETFMNKYYPSIYGKKGNSIGEKFAEACVTKREDTHQVTKDDLQKMYDYIKNNQNQLDQLGKDLDQVNQAAKNVDWIANMVSSATPAGGATPNNGGGNAAANESYSYYFREAEKNDQLQYIIDLNKQLNKYKYYGLDKVAVTPQEFEKKRRGNYFEFCIYQDAKLKEAGIPHNTYLIGIMKDKNSLSRCHTFTVAKVNGEYIYMESCLITLSKIKDVYRAKNLDDIFNFVSSYLVSIYPENEYMYYFIDNFDNSIKPGLSVEEFFTIALNKTPIKSGKVRCGNMITKGLIKESYITEADGDKDNQVVSTSDTAGNTGGNDNTANGGEKETKADTQAQKDVQVYFKCTSQLLSAMMKTSRDIYHLYDSVISTHMNNVQKEAKNRNKEEAPEVASTATGGTAQITK